MQILKKNKNMFTRSNFEDTGRPGLSLARRSPADMMAPLLSSGLCGLLLQCNKIFIFDTSYKMAYEGSSMDKRGFSFT